MYNQQLDRIAEKLARLRTADPQLRAFGAESHGYRISPPVPESALQDYEKQAGVSLPAQFRHFLTRIGAGGAGPFYGIFEFASGDPEDITDLAQVRKPFRWTDAINPYDWEDPCAEEDVWCDEDAEEGEPTQIILNVPGAIYVCHYGCAIRFFLVVNGAAAGEVWRDSQADDAGLTPECGADGERLGFLDWYERWLDSSLT